MTPELETEIAQVAAAAGSELVHAAWKGGVLRLILDRAEGITLGDCEHVARQVSALLDVLDFGKSRYVLEVSSPGLDRQLYRPSDYERFLGRLARVTFESPGPSGALGSSAGGAKRTVVGRLAEFHPAAAPGAAAEVVIVDEKTGERHVVGLESIRLGRLEIEL
ncbi:MAG TPA: ribosome maturation factor [Thermoanaerobaculia bacterium]|nr:ribosome maturation factor [Thermoanaerobaculia bacterium]